MTETLGQQLQVVRHFWFQHVNDQAVPPASEEFKEILSQDTRPEDFKIIKFENKDGGRLFDVTSRYISAFRQFFRPLDVASDEVLWVEKPKTPELSPPNSVVELEDGSFGLKISIESDSPTKEEQDFLKSVIWGIINETAGFKTGERIGGFPNKVYTKDNSLSLSDDLKTITIDTPVFTGTMEVIWEVTEIPVINPRFVGRLGSADYFPDYEKDIAE